MKLTMFRWPAIIFFIWANLLACHPEPVQKEQPPPPIDYSVLPPITQEGKNTFGCKVNGEVWVPRVELFTPWYDKAASFSEKDGKGVGSIDCRLLNKDTDNWLQIVFGPTYFNQGVFSCAKANSTSMQMQISHDWYQINNKDTLHNWVKITRIDTSKNIVSGEFQFNLYNIANLKDTLSITEGRFDMLYYPE